MLERNVPFVHQNLKGVFSAGAIQNRVGRPYRTGRVFLRRNGNERRGVGNRQQFKDSLGKVKPRGRSEAGEVVNAAQIAGNFASISKNMRYRSGWYVIDDAPQILFAMGIHGQNLFVDRANRIVIAKVSSQNQPIDPQACKRGYGDDP